MEGAMVNGKQEPKPGSVDPHLRMDTELEADPMLRLSEGKASRLQITVIGLVAIVIVGVVIWSMSQP